MPEGAFSMALEYSKQKGDDSHQCRQRLPLTQCLRLLLSAAVPSPCNRVQTDTSSLGVPGGLRAICDMDNIVIHRLAAELLTLQ